MAGHSAFISSKPGESAIVGVPIKSRAFMSMTTVELDAETSVTAFIH